MKQKITAILITLCMVLAIMPITALAANETVLDISQGNIEITNDGVNIGGVATYASNANGYIITGTTTQNNVTVTAKKANITIKDLNIVTGGYRCAFSIAKDSTVTLTLSGKNTLTSGQDYAGLWVPVGASVTIQSATGYSTDSLVAKGGGGAAGIGGSNYETVNSAGADCGEITINSGTVKATGLNRGAGIGGGLGGNGGIVTISAVSDNSTVVTATGGTHSGAGIGGGASYVVVDLITYDVLAICGAGSGKTIIKGGTVTATGYGDGAGIGAGNGDTGGDGVDVTIDGGSVTANGASADSPGIGGKNVDIVINGGTVIATGHGDAGATQGTLSLKYMDGYKWRTSATGSFSYSDKQVYRSSDANKYLEVAPGIAITAFLLDKSVLALYVNDTASLIATIKPTNATNKKITWSSSNTNVATVDETGGITAIGAGTATITATTANGKTDTCKVTVTEIAVEGVELNKATAALTVGDTETLTATIKPDNATNKAITWSSSDTDVATVDENGKITAIDGGEATITATTANNTTATCVVTVTVPVTGVELNKVTAALTVGDTETLAATIKPTNATNKAITWSSSDTSVATVDENGVVVAIGAGTATITATADNGTAADCEVTVSEETGGILGFLRMVKMILELIIYIMGVFA